MDYVRMAESARNYANVFANQLKEFLGSDVTMSDSALKSKEGVQELRDALSTADLSDSQSLTNMVDSMFVTTLEHNIVDGGVDENGIISGDLGVLVTLDANISNLLESDVIDHSTASTAQQMIKGLSVCETLENLNSKAIANGEQPPFKEKEIESFRKAVIQQDPLIAKAVLLDYAADPSVIGDNSKVIDVVSLTALARWAEGNRVSALNAAAG